MPVNIFFYCNISGLLTYEHYDLRIYNLCILLLGKLGLLILLLEDYFIGGH